MKSLTVALVGASLLVLAAAGLSAQEELVYVEVTKLLAFDAGFSDFFGDTLAIDGDTLVIGGDDFGVGGAYVYERNQGGSNAWGLIKKLLGSGAEDFGRFVDMQGDLVAVGANDVDAVGSVSLFERNAGGPGNWGMTGKLLAPDGPQPGRIFATPAIDGNQLVVGALGDEEAGFFAGGAAYVFERDETASLYWQFEQKVIASDTRDLARFGEVLDMDGETFVVSAPNLEVEDENGAGAAYVFEKEGAIWVEKKKLTAPVPESDGKFGEGLAMEGDIIAVGHPGEDSNDGAVYVYGRDIGGADNWGLDAHLMASDTEPGTSFGVSIDLDQNRLLVGANISKDETDDAGAVYVFEKDGAGNWIELVRLDASDRTEFHHFGDAVGISGGTLVSGAGQDDEGGLTAGAAYVFQVVAHPQADITGSCPGEITFELSGATPSGTVFVAYATGEGTTILPGGACAGAELALEAGQFLVRFAADGAGTEIATAVAPQGACGLYLQVLDGLTCGVGPVVQVP